MLGSTSELKVVGLNTRLALAIFFSLFSQKMRQDLSKSVSITECASGKCQDSLLDFKECFGIWHLPTWYS